MFSRGGLLGAAGLSVPLVTQPSIVAGSLLPGGITSGNPLVLPNYVVSAGTNRALFLMLSNNYVHTPSSITFGAQSFTLVGRAVGATYTAMHAYYLLNPTVGTENITISMPANGIMYAVAFLVDGVNQTTPVADGTGSNTTSNTTSITVPNRTANDLVIGGVSVDNNTGSSVAVTTGTLIQAAAQSWADSGFAYNDSGAVVAFSHYNAERSGYAFRVLAA